MISPGTPSLPKFPSLDGRQSTGWGVTPGQWVPLCLPPCAQLFQLYAYIQQVPNKCLSTVHRKYVTNVCHLYTPAKP